MITCAFIFDINYRLLSIIMLIMDSATISAENSLLSLGGQTVHQNEQSSGPPEKLAVHITFITKMVANSHFITEHSWLIMLNL